MHKMQLVQRRRGTSDQESEGLEAFSAPRIGYNAGNEARAQPTGISKQSARKEETL